jgi:AhpD family alkylhydroperoxidase
LKALQGVGNAVKQADIPETTLYLVELRASQINGCGVCVDIHSRELKHAGEPDERINTVAVWRDVSYFTEPERAALALTEAATRLADRPDPVPDDVWDNAAAPLRQPAARRARARDRRDQHLESPQRHHEADQRRLGGRVGCPKPERQRGSLTRAGSTAPAVRYGERRWRAPLAIALERAECARLPCSPGL